MQYRLVHLPIVVIASLLGPVFVGNAAQHEAVRLSPHLIVSRGAINVGVVLDGDRALLIDCATDCLKGIDELPASLKVTQIAVTHYHRDQLCGARHWIDQGAELIVPEAERDYVSEPATWWTSEQCQWRVYRSFRPDHLLPVEALPVARTISDGDQWQFGAARIRAIATPGHTDGSVSYIVDVDGQRVVFSGDCIYGPGQIWDVYSLQKGFEKNGRRIGGYHGFMGAQWDLAESLTRIKDERPRMIVPSHGQLIDEPVSAIDQLLERIDTCYENYVAISALRHYFPQLFTDYEGRPGQMPIRPGFEPPDCLRHFGTTWMLVSKSGAALVMDAGSPAAVKQVQMMLKNREITSVEGLWITHYHHDHTDAIPEFRQAIDCPCIVDATLADVLRRPSAWRLPCVAPEPTRVDQPCEDGRSWQWHEFRLTSFFYPGQTLYHGALLVEKDDLKMLFVGDSHTMAGIDDYCAHNRNWLGRGVGFQYCLSLVERIRPTHMFNCHVKDAFTFTDEEIRFMRANLDTREKLFGELVPWDHANYGLDPSWVRCDPYVQQVAPGDTARWRVVFTNHSASDRTARCRTVPPKAFSARAAPWVSREVASKKEQSVEMQLAIPDGLSPGRYVCPIDVRYGDWDLPQFTEAIVDIVPASER